MTARGDVYRAALDRAHTHALTWLDSIPDRPIGPRQTADQMLDRLATRLPDGPSDPAAVVDLLAEIGDPGLMAMGSGRFYGWVIGGTLPAAMAADWLVSAWDNTPGLRYIAPTAAAAEDAAAGWLLDLLGLPTGSDVGFTTGATMASFTGLMAGRFQVLADAGWDVNTRGLSGAPAVTTLVGAERHDTIDCALRYLGLGAPVRWQPTTRDGSASTRWLRRWSKLADRQSCACRLETFTPACSTRSVKQSRWRMRTARGCMWTGRSDCGPPRRRACAIT
jgi:hypothetical protein